MDEKSLISKEIQMLRMNLLIWMQHYVRMAQLQRVLWMRSRLWMQTAAVSHPPILRKQFITTFRIMIYYYYYYLLSRLQRSHNFKSNSFCTYLLPVIRFPGFLFFFGGGPHFNETKKIWKIK